MRKRKAPIVEDDEIMAEVRKMKAQVWEKAGGTLEGLFRRMRELQEQTPPHLRVDRSTKGKWPFPGDDPKS
jgi:hypothetical protein